MALLAGSIVGLILLGMPLGFAIILACLFVIWIDGGINPVIVAQRLYAGMDSFTLLAIPFFLLAGSLMSASGMTTRLVAFANAIVGRISGGLAMSNIVASTFFSGISGSAVADTSVFGRIFIPEMVREGYGRAFSVAVTAAASVAAPIIPPSIGFIVYGVITDQSIIRLFLAGVVPGVIYSVACLAIAVVISRRRAYPVHDPIGWRDFARVTVAALPALFMPVLILGGIFGGVFTITECSAIAVVYALIVGRLVYRELTVAKFLQCLRETAYLTGVIMIIVGAANLFAWQLAYAQVPQTVVAWMQVVIHDPIFFLLAIGVLLLLVGTFMEANAAMVMLVPILHPAGVMLGVDPIQLGVLVVVTLCIGLITPPIGLCLNVACKIGDIPLERSLRDIAPFIVTGLIVMAIVIMFPQVALWLPNLVMG
jgi:TRAP-type transport system large permease protein